MSESICKNRVPIVLSIFVTLALMLVGVNGFVAIVVAIMVNGLLEFFSPKVGNPVYGGYSAVSTAAIVHLLMAGMTT